MKLSSIATILFSCLLLASGACGEDSNDAAPWFCHGLDCPKYKVINETDKYQIRKLEGAKYAATSVESLLYSVGLTEGFQRLFKYISGANEANQKIAMTAPVVTEVTPGDGPFCKSVFLTGFFVPFKWQDKPPVPSNKLVTIKTSPSIYIAVSQFGGFLVDDYTLSSKAEALQEALKQDGIDFVSENFFTAGYDPPYRLQHRHNEIWVRLGKKDALEPVSA